jgi:hypothetical protein
VRRFAVFKESVVTAELKLDDKYTLGSNNFAFGGENLQKMFN